MIDPCRCGERVRHAYESWTCVDCGRPCCPACAERDGRRVACLACAGRPAVPQRATA